VRTKSSRASQESHSTVNQQNNIRVLIIEMTHAFHASRPELTGESQKLRD
jgi:hypothetical protein